MGFSRCETADQLEFGFFDGTSWVAVQDTNITTGVWINYILVYNGTAVEVFRNGVSIGTDLQNNSVSLTGGTLTQGTNANAHTLFYNGSMDEFSIYDRNISAAEVAQIYNNGTAFNPFTITTPQILTNLSAFYNVENITVQLNTTSPVNMSVSIDEVLFKMVTLNVNC